MSDPGGGAAPTVTGHSWMVPHEWERCDPGRDCRADSEVEVEAERIVKLIHEMERDAADHAPDAFDSHGADLFGLCLGVDVEAGLVGGKQRLERVDMGGVGRDGDHRYHPAAESLRCRSGSVVANDHARTRVRSFAPDDRVKVDEADLTATHQASAVAVSQAALSGSSDHSVNAAA